MRKSVLFTLILYFISIIIVQADYKVEFKLENKIADFNMTHQIKSANTINNDSSNIRVIKSAINNNGLEVKLLDLYSRIYIDRFPYDGSCVQPVSVPKNYTLSFQLAIKSSANQRVRVTLEDLKNTEGRSFPGKFMLRRLLPVHVEGNTQGSMINRPGGKTPASWKPYFIRIAPFDVLEAVEDFKGNSIAIEAGQITGALLQLYIPANCFSGFYKGEFVVQDSRGSRKNIPISFVVHKTVVPENYFLNCTHWLSGLPKNLKSGVPVEWWSEAHWKLLVRAGKLLRQNGDNTMFTPLVNTRHPLIQTLWNNQEKKLSFDYYRFDQWLHTFDTLGFKYFAGEHLKFLGTNLYIKNIETGDTISLSNINIRLEYFQEVFLKDLYKHLVQTGMKYRYIQHLFDEPSPAALDEYKHYDAILKMSMPDIKSIDAINSKPDLFSKMVDIEVFNLPGIILNKNLVNQRLNEGNSTWLYNTSSPYPPYPNRNLDFPLIENRLWPWLCYKYNAAGYLWWAANLYRGVPDEYKTSLGPLPNGVQNPGHPPGGAWFYYRTTKGLIPSLRTLSFREGMIDVTLLSMLRKVDSSKLQTIMSKLIFPEIEIGQNRPFSDYLMRAETIPKGFETSVAKYNEARENILTLLDHK